MPFSYTLGNHEVPYGPQLMKSHVCCKRGKDGRQVLNQGNRGTFKESNYTAKPSVSWD